MAEILSILSKLHTAGQALRGFARQTRQWQYLSNRLLDLEESLMAIELTLENWQWRYDIQLKKPPHYTWALFGRQGCGYLRETFVVIDSVADDLKNHIDSLIELALRAIKVRISPEQLYDAAFYDLIQDSIAKIRQKRSWTRSFYFAALKKSESLENRLGCLHIQLNSLERLSSHYAEQEHPQRFCRLERLPGKTTIHKAWNEPRESAQGRLLNILSAQKDAQLLYRASGEHKVHIGISVPQIHRQDFAFLFQLNGKSHEVLAHPVKIRVDDPLGVPTTFSDAITTLKKSSGAACFMLPSSSTSAGFQLSIPLSNLLSLLQSKEPLSSIVRSSISTQSLCSQILYAHDQNVVASEIAQACFRLLGSRWLDFLDSTNVRWRRTSEGKWTSMLTAIPGDLSITRVLEQYLAHSIEFRQDKDLVRYSQVFRVGLVLTELALKIPISHISFDAVSRSVKIFVPISSLRSSLSSSPTRSQTSFYQVEAEEFSALSIAAEVERCTNIYLANMVHFCLSALQNDTTTELKSIEDGYAQCVLKDAEILAALMKEESRRSLFKSVPSLLLNPETPRLPITAKKMDVPPSRTLSLRLSNAHLEPGKNRRSRDS